jgi:S1-C subfamily serine protease
MSKLLLTCMTLLAAPQDGALLENVQKEWASLARKAGASVVEVRAGGRRFAGVVISDKGHILTDASGLAGGRDVTARTARGEERKLLAEPCVDPLTGLAILQVEPSGLTPIAFAAATPEPGMQVLLIGNPYGIGKTVTQATVAAVGRMVRGRAGPVEDLIQLSAPAYPGDGGALVADVRGELAGIVVAGAGIPAAEGPGPPPALGATIPFAVPADVAAFVSARLIERRVVERGWLGVSAHDPDDATRAQLGIQGGAVVEEVAPGGPAWGKIKQHDVLVRLNHQPIADLHALRMAVWAMSDGTPVTVELMRRRELLKVELTAGKMPAGPREVRR